MAIGVREAGIDDLGALVALRRAWAAEDGRAEGPEFERRFADWFVREASRRRFWIADDAGEPIAFANLLLFDRMPTPGRPPGGWGYLGNMFVVASHRDRGVGSLLLGAITDFADALGLERIVLNPSSRSIPFYARAQFDPADELMVRVNPNGQRRGGSVCGVGCRRRSGGRR